MRSSVSPHILTSKMASTFHVCNTLLSAQSSKGSSLFLFFFFIKMVNEFQGLGKWMIGMSTSLAWGRNPPEKGGAASLRIQMMVCVLG